MFNGVVFDLDGVIVDSHPVHKRAWHSFFASLGKEVTDSQLDFILEGRRRRDILIHFLGELSDSELQEYGSKKDDFFRKECQTMEPVAGSIEFIQELSERGLGLAVATSASRERACWTLEEFGISKCFKVVVTGDDVQESKPDPAIYRLAAVKLRLSPECLVAVEDSVCGVRAAKSAGLRCLAIASSTKIDELTGAGADRVLTSLVAISIRDLEELFNAFQVERSSGTIARPYTHRSRKIEVPADSVD